MRDKRGTQRRRRSIFSLGNQRLAVDFPRRSRSRAQLPRRPAPWAAKGRGGGNGDCPPQCSAFPPHAVVASQSGLHLLCHRTPAYKGGRRALPNCHTEGRTRRLCVGRPNFLPWPPAPAPALTSTTGPPATRGPLRAYPGGPSRPPRIIYYNREGHLRRTACRQAEFPPLAARARPRGRRRRDPLFLRATVRIYGGSAGLYARTRGPPRPS